MKIAKLPDDYKLEDVDIFNFKGVHMPLMDGSYAFIGQLSAYNWFYVYLPGMQSFFKYCKLIIPDLTLLEDLKDAGKVQLFHETFTELLRSHKMRLFYIKLLRKLGVFKGSLAKFQKRISEVQLPEIFVLLYKFNSDGLKKKLISLAEMVFTETPSSSGISSLNASAMGGLRNKLMIVDKIDAPARSMN
jgi:hypothetical protein